MGYTIRIGQAVLESEAYSEYSNQLEAWWTVDGEVSDAAPFSTDSGRGNQRDPSYTTWDLFAREVGLHAFFFDKDSGLMRRHPGCFRLTKLDAETVEKALHDYKQSHPDVEAVFCECKACVGFAMKDSPHNPRADPQLVRLEWLAFWVRWAVENCEKPAIYNG